MVNSKGIEDIFEFSSLIYKTLANSKRLEILSLVKDKEMTVNAISKELNARKSNVSQHLFILKNLGLVKNRRNGRNIFYRVADPEIIEHPSRYIEKYHKG